MYRKDECYGIITYSKRSRKIYCISISKKRLNGSVINNPDSGIVVTTRINDRINNVRREPSLNP